VLDRLRARSLRVEVLPTGAVRRYGQLDPASTVKLLREVTERAEALRPLEGS